MPYAGRVYRYRYKDKSLSDEGEGARVAGTRFGSVGLSLLTFNGPIRGEKGPACVLFRTTRPGTWVGIKKSGSL